LNCAAAVMMMWRSEHLATVLPSVAPDVAEQQRQAAAALWAVRACNATPRDSLPRALHLR
jgi:hypothetical protein